jgi:hypothetical protein
MKSKAMQIMEMKKATLECNPLFKDKRRCVALFEEETDEIYARLSYLEKFYERYGSRRLSK